jgi:hypothetical protein
VASDEPYSPEETGRGLGMVGITRRWRNDCSHHGGKKCRGNGGCAASNPLLPTVHRRSGWTRCKGNPEGLVHAASQREMWRGEGKGARHAGNI